MNRLSIIGNLTDDPSRGESQGKTVCNFTVAVNRRQKGKDGASEADFFRVSAWEQLGENCMKYLGKGKKVAVVGPVNVRTFQRQDGTTGASMNVRALEVEFLSPVARGDADDSAYVQKAPSEVTPNLTPVEPQDGELPF